MKFLKAVTILLLLIVVYIASLFFWGFYAPESALGEPVTIHVERGSSAMTIGTQLEKNNIIPNARLFYYYLRVKNLNGSLKAGMFKIPENAGIVRASLFLQNPIPEGVTVQITEGQTIWQTADIIASAMDIDTAVFIDLCKDSLFIASLGLEGDTSLEGYLFPETYQFPKGADERAIITQMVTQFNKIYRELDFTGKAARWNRSKIVTMASVVEKEAQAPHERKRISAVFHNRIDKGIPLGADPTVRYAIKKFSGPLRVSELKNSSPYNTRIHKGLMPGPICSPGKDALQAAISPSSTDELFFVAKWDGSGEHYFSVTNAEHNRKKMKVRRENKELSNW